MRHFRDAELVVIEGAGHTLFGEKPQASVAAVRRYLDGPADRPIRTMGLAGSGGIAPPAPGR